MSFVDRLVAFGKRYLMIGVVVQILVTVIAGIVALIEGFVVFVVGMALYFPGPKYGPPPTPEPIVKYGPAPTPDQIIPALNTPEGIVGLLVLAGSLALYAWTILGWLFWGSILYLKMKEKK